jgi:hypothetical protein
LKEAVMKSIAIKISFLSVLILGLGLVSAQAQSSARYRGTIPFDFTARGAKMKAGEYILGDFSHGLMLRSQKGRSAAILGPASNTSGTYEEKGTLVFVRNGDSYTLTEVNTAAYKLKIKHTVTAVNVAMSNSKPEIVEIGLVN